MMSEKQYHLGLDVGGTKLAAGIVDEDYRIVVKRVVPSPAKESVEEIVRAMYEVCRNVLSEAGIIEDSIKNLGIGMPSYVNPKTGCIVNANCFGWRNVPIFDYMGQIMPWKVKIENDANCAALGELLAGNAKGYKNVVMLTIGTGLGSGIIMNGEIFSGADHMGAELGHTKLILNGLKCTCGQKGCAESYCSGTALVRLIRKRLQTVTHSLLWEYCDGKLEKINGSMLFEAAAAGDYTANEIMQQYIGYLSGAISSFITIFRPELILLGGGVANAGDDLVRPLRKKLMEDTFAADEIGIPDIRIAKLGSEAGIVGAAMLK